MRSIRTAVVALAAATALALSLAPTVQPASAETSEETTAPTELVPSEPVVAEETTAPAEPSPSATAAAEQGSAPAEPVPTTDASTELASEGPVEPVAPAAVPAEEPVPLSEAFSNPHTALRPETYLSPDSSAKTQNFIAGLVEAARQNQRDTGIPASVAIGQAALETGWGGSKMAKPPINSYFSIKCGGTTPFANGCVDVNSKEHGSSGWYWEVSSFRTYATVGHSLQDYGRLLSGNSRYRGAFKYSDDPDSFIREVHRAGYATDPGYSKTVIGIMKTYNLYRYNLPVVPTAGFNPDWIPGPLPARPAKPDVIPQFVPGPDFPAYSNGSREQGVRTLQHLLNARAGAGLEVDGVFGAASRSAVSSYQRGAGVKATGVMDDKTWAALLPKVTSGATGTTVTAVQEELNQAGFRVAVSGNFDVATVNAVKAFQRHHQIRPTGDVTAVVWARMLDW